MITGEDNGVCGACDTIQKMNSGSGFIVCENCGELGLTPIFATEDEARDYQDDVASRYDFDTELAYVHDAVGDDHYWFVDVMQPSR